MEIKDKKNCTDQNMLGAYLKWFSISDIPIFNQRF